MRSGPCCSCRESSKNEQHFASCRLCKKPHFYQTYRSNANVNSQHAWKDPQGDRFNLRSNLLSEGRDTLLAAMRSKPISSDFFILSTCNDASNLELNRGSKPKTPSNVDSGSIFCEMQPHFHSVPATDEWHEILQHGSDILDAIQIVDMGRSHPWDKTDASVLKIKR